MKMMETIIIRAANGLSRSILQRLADEIMPNKPSEGLGTLVMLRNAFVETDVCIQVQWEFKGHEPARSDLGMELAAALEEFGRVHHTIWIQDGTSIGAEKNMGSGGLGSDPGVKEG